MVGALNKLPISIFGMLLFTDPVGVGQIAGVLLGTFSTNILSAFGAGILYSFAKNKQNAGKAAEAVPLPLHNPRKVSPASSSVLYESKVFKD